VPASGETGVTNRETPLRSRSPEQDKIGNNPEPADQDQSKGRAKFIRARVGETRKAAFDLAERAPERSARTGPSYAQLLIAGLLAIALAGFVLAAPSAFMLVLRRGLYLVFGYSILFRVLLLLVHVRFGGRAEGQNTPSEDPDIWPVYTLLLPVYREGKILPSLVAAMEGLNYPRGRLDIKLLLEEDDEETLTVARNMTLGSHWEVLIVPNTGPRTKPKALNVGLARAKGSLVTIYDAEDRPHRDQLRAAVAAFAADDGKLACVQAPLGYYNAKQNWLTGQFSLEYDAQFRVILPALVRLGLAFPLGGTSNHFRRSALEETGGWDPFNVTEDADLGYRLAENGWRAGVIEPPTLEEATAGLRPWVGQRSRWIKGFMQTTGVHLRGAIPGGKVKHAIGFFSILGLSIVSAFAHAFLALGALICLACWPFIGPVLTPMEVGFALAGMSMAWALLVAGARARRKSPQFGMIASAALYWPLQTWAAIRALIELFSNPFHWVKTEHGHSLDKN
jgi:cellulose synthase/poly-beta-1,6-N-acetylglucosamine synthase-like glycosyltransferase